MIDYSGCKDGDNDSMIIWIDGAYGVGKTAVAMRIKELLSDSEAELLESDYYSNESLRRLVEEAKASNSFPHIGGVLPQNNMRFIIEFRELIVEKSQDTDKKLIIDMALTMVECKENLIDYLESEGKDIVHVILTADEETIKLRIKNDENRMKETALEWLTQNISFLDRNFPDAIRIKTDNRDVDDIANEIMGKIESRKK